MKRIQRKRTKGWKMPPNTIYVGRGSKWGNPFRVVERQVDIWCVKYEGGNYLQQRIAANICRAEYDDKLDAISDAVACYKSWLRITGIPDAGSLKNRDVACWCATDMPCHADFLLSWVERL